MSYGYLGMNYLRSGFLPIARRLRSRVAVLFEGALKDYEQCDREGLIEIPIVRKWLEGEPGQVDARLAQWAGQPLWPTENENYDRGRELADALVACAPFARVYQSYNEKATYALSQGELSRFAVFELGFVDRLHERGRQAIVLNPPVGNLDAEHLREFDELFAVADFVGAHTYGAEGGQLMAVNPMDYAMRPRAWIQDARQRGVRFPPLVRTEAGTWGPWKGSQPDVRPVSADLIANDLRWLGEQMTQESYEAGVAVWCCLTDGNPRWDGWDLSNEDGILATMEQFNREHPGRPLTDASRRQEPWFQVGVGFAKCEVLVGPWREHEIYHAAGTDHETSLAIGERGYATWRRRTNETVAVCDNGELYSDLGNRGDGTLRRYHA